MKKTTLLTLLLGIISATCFAQEKTIAPKAIEYSDVTNTEEYPLYMSDLTYENGFEKSESELIGKYALLTSQVLQKYVSQEDKENCDYDAAKDMFRMRQGKLYDYDIADGSDTYCGSWWDTDNFSYYRAAGHLFFDGCILNIKKSIRHQLSQNKDFRDALFNTICDFVCDLTMLFPKDFKSSIISEIKEIQNILNDIPNHQYELASYNKENTCFYFKEDGIKNYGIGYTTRGWILRRIYMDKIPLEEIKQKVEYVFAKIQGVDNSNNADVAFIYKIAKGILYCVGRVNYLYSSALGCEYFVNDGIIEKVIENGITFFSLTNYENIYYENISDSEELYRKMGFFRKNTTLKIDEDGNFVNVNVEYSK